MNSQEILCALQAGKISFEDAQEKLTKQIYTVLEQSAKIGKVDRELYNGQKTSYALMNGIEDEKEIQLKVIKDTKIRRIGQREMVSNADNKSLILASREYLKALIADVTKMPLNKLDVEASFEELGLDSIMIAQLNPKVEQWIGRLDTTLFFKYNNIKTLANYFLEVYPEAVSMLVNKAAATISTSTLTDQNQRLAVKKEMFSTYSDEFSPITIGSSIPNAYENTDIAIIGIAGRYPKAETLEQFWVNLCEGKDCIEEIPSNRWSLDGFFEPDRAKAIAKGLSYSKWGGFLEDISHFDPLFFNISPRDAIFIDPQERLFLEVAWECLEDAGYTRKSLEKNGYGNQIGVFVGATYNNYQLFMAEAAQRANQDMYTANSQIFSIANRVSYVMNFTGPSLTVDTACASSLYAVHLACESIRSGQSRMAIAGGVNLSLHPSKYITLCQGQFNASDGRCRAFCEGGTGYVPSEAVGAVFLKPLQDAINDHDLIYGVIKGSATSHGGRTNGFTVPSPVSQSLAIEKAMLQGKIDPRSISCIEAHGTGTALGDPIEIAGLTDVFQKYTQDTSFCAISSVKSNVGHAEAAAGITQLTKVLLQLKHKTLVKNVMHGDGLNPNIDFSKTPFVVQKNTEHWKRPIIDGQELPRRAGISSFGAGGANAHVVIEEYICNEQEQPETTVITQNPVLIVLSAKNEDCLKKQVQYLLAFIEKQQFSDLDLVDMAYTLQIGREAMEERLAVIVESMKELKEKLKKILEGRDDFADLYRGQVKRNKEVIAIFAEDDNMATTVDEWVINGKYAELLDLWTKGLSVDWNKLYADSKPHRISLPTYPFLREHYWVQKNKIKSVNIEENLIAASLPTRSDSPMLSQKQEDFEMMTFEEVWQEQTLVKHFPNKIKNIVCFLSKPENQQMIVEAIQTFDRETRVIFISQSITKQEQSQQTYSISRNNEKTYEQAFQNIREQYGEVDGMFYLWALEDSSCIQDYSSIVYILKSIAAAKLKTKRVLFAGQFENGLDRCYLESWIGFERSLGLVMPNTKVGTIYQEAGEQNRKIGMKDWLQKLWGELHTPKVQSVLYQEGKRLVCQVKPTTLTSGRNVLKLGGTYLITGGCGGLGLLFAKHFAQSQSVKLILMGRSPMNAEKEAKIRELEELGSEVLYVQADVCNLASMKEGVTQAKERFGAIHGVIHAAGIVGNQNILEKDIGNFQKVLDPKIKGTMVLDELLAEEILDFVCYFSSSAAILGDFGACDYAIANRFEMAYAHYRKQQQRQGKTIVINWPLWKDGGMGVGDEKNTKMYLKSSGQRFLESEEGVTIFDRLLTQANTQHLVSVGKPNRVYQFLGMTSEKNSTYSSIVSSLSGKGRRVGMKGLSLEQCVEWDLKEYISQLLNISRDKLDIEENLADFGFDSVSLAQFSNELTNHYGMEISPSLFFGYSTIGNLTQYFLADHQETMQIFYQENEEVPELNQGSSVGTLTSKHHDFSETRIVMEKKSSSMQEPIAIIGMSGRFPQARSIDEMWQILLEGKDVVQELSEERFSSKAFGKSKYKCGCIPGISEFDPLFFEISPLEAETMDPRQRLLLQESWRALEDAGYGSSQLKTNKIGMFVGVEEGDYRLLIKGKRSITSNHNGVLAARLAYFLNLSGPNMAINTACSSGLVAAHQACLSLRNQECDTALAAGVNLMFTHEMFAGMSEAGMLSEDGKCFAFDQRANGMVPGEAVAVVVLKRLSQAKIDGDPIYAVIKGNGINYDGKTNGITAPSGVAQTKLLKSVYDQYKIDPEEIEYVVTHGTGTKLGDPIEINALYDAFKEYTKKQGYCALTSAKTNFGHTLAASGLVSLISLVQSLRYETIPASLNCNQENDYIRWQESPFYVNKKNQLWSQNNEKRRMGAVSAFGMSGTNVHMVVENYPVKEEMLGDEKSATYYLLVLSAKTQESLQEKIKELIGGLQDSRWHEKRLSQVSYTLLEGRQHFNHRCAIVVQDREDAIYVLQQIGTNEKVPNLFQGKVSRGFTGQKAIKEYGQDLLKQSFHLMETKKRYQEILYALADLYCQGYELSWDLLYGDKKPDRIHLPTYPFVREHYWIPEGNLEVANNEGTVAFDSWIHPLLHANTSNFSEQRFSSTFTGEEFFLKDHVVKGQRVLPGVAYLEMARAAVEQAVGALRAEETVIQLKNVVWSRPITVGNQPIQVHIGLFPEENGEITYEIYSKSKEGGEAVVHSQGSAAIVNSSKDVNIDIKELQAECSQSVLSPVQCYGEFEKIGITYGPGHRGIEKVYVGLGKVLAKLTVPSSVVATQDQFIMHPSLMDASLQACIGLMMSSGVHKTLLPFALQELEVIKKCTPVMWALIRHSEGSQVGDKVQKIDIDLCDEQGTICTRMQGFSSRMLGGELGATRSASTIGTVMFEPFWMEQIISQEVAVSYTKHVVILCEENVMIQEKISAEVNGVSCIVLQSKGDDIGEHFQNCAIQVFEEIQNILRDKPKDRVLIQIITEMEKKTLSGLSGLLKTAQLENPNIIGQLIEVGLGNDCDEVVGKIKENSRNPINNHICYRDGKRWGAGFKQIKVDQEAAKIPWKDQGIYLITGGAGGLGLIFAKEIAQQVKNATLILTGRSSLNKEKQDKIRELELLGTQVEYKQVDVTDKKAVDSLIKNIQEEFGNLNGIIHGAGVIQDNFIIRKSKEEMQNVLAPKVLGLVNLDEASKDLSLEFFILFSSTTGCLGNSGQVDYAAANSFMDAYAEHRNTLLRLKQRQGKTLSINWPLWKDGGMSVDETTEKMMIESLGMIAMPTEAGIQALYQGLGAGKDQVMVIEGDIKKITESFLEQQCNNSQGVKISSLVEVNKVVPVIAQDLLQEKSVTYFKQLLSAAIKLPAHRIEADAPMEDYGIDSMMVMQLTNELEKKFGSLPKTLFFEYQNIKEITEYFLESHHKKMIELLGIREEKVLTTEMRRDNIETVAVKPSSGISRRPRFIPQSMEYQEERKTAGHDIAIIGVSGRYPGAKDVQEFWRNLRDGKDCITEIPKGRWDHSLYYDEDKNKPGKTYSKWGGFLDGVDQFDPLFFNISPREAEFIDPQERLFLQCVFETIEDAGYTREALRKHKGFGLEGNIGVYVGVMYEEYQLYGAQETIQGRPIALGGNPSSIANRVSYFCNFHGPSMAVDTMCSSSLTAIHLACQSLERGGCELAIAGGVNVSIHPNKYLMLGQGKFVSSKGRCESFGEGGDGYVPGEGVGAVLLKPLAKAIADGDQIYGVIKGTSINHGGKTNGYTVPNLNAQSAVISQAFKESGINPRTISYVEAHGTGTSLGDPIEIAGLNKGFREFTTDTQFCAIGSAKSNIGHCESAAGIAGVTKILLQLKHHQLVPSLHSKVLNPGIDFSNTPFVVQQELTEWKRPVIDGQEYPRLAGISSFGAGGSNAHVVIEEYHPANQKEFSNTSTDQQPIIIVLSAKTEERLRDQAKRLLLSIQEQSFSDASLVNMSYTLQVGREAMEERLAVLVRSINELEEKLKRFIEGRDDIEGLYHGQVKRNKESFAIFATDEDMVITVDAWISKKKFEKLLSLWVKGLNCDWSKLYSDRLPQRMSLPTYPFAQERYWVPNTDGKSSLNTASTSIISTFIHPLLQQNTSDFFEQRFSSTFVGTEFFLKDHVVKGQRVLPAVAYLEMARAAVEQASGILGVGKTGMQLKNVVWVKPIIVEEQPVHVHVGLSLEENGEITYEIYSQPEEIGIEPVVHSQGSASLLNSIMPVETLDITALQAECSQKVFSASQCYEEFAKIGITYGMDHQGIERVYVGLRKVLAKIVLPSSLATTQEQFVLHPSVMDSALQATIGFVLGTDNRKLALPFALQELEIMEKCTSTMWVLLCHSEGSKSGDKIQKLDIRLCDEQGRVCVRMKGFSSRVAEREMDKLASVEKTGMLMLEPVWKVQDISLETAALDYIQQVVIFCEPSDEVKKNIPTYFNEVDFIILQSEKQGIAERFKHYSLQVFEKIKTILNSKPKGKVLIQIVVAIQREQQLFSGLTGLLKTAQLENPQLIGQLIEVELGEQFESMVEKLNESSRSPMEKHIRYEDNKRWCAELNEIEISQETVQRPWKEGGIYLITGGAGGLGLIFAQEISQSVSHTTLILTGRSSLNREKEAKLQELEALGARIIYYQVDVTDQQAVTNLLEKIKDEFGDLHGIIHSAGMIRDNFIIRKSNEELEEVLGPKVSGIVNLDAASKDIRLDFFILFSSITGSLGNPGQADYAVANAFMDAYAGYRNELVTLQQRHGQTLSMNWPLWKNGGMHVNEDTEKMMEQNTGMIAMRTATGIRALYRGFTSKKNQVLVLEGNVSRIKSLEHFLSLDSHDNSSKITNQVELDNNFYKNIIGKIAEDELSKEEFENLIK